MLTHLLKYRFMLVNVAFVAGVLFAIERGWAEAVYRGDSSYITWAITAFFIVAWVWTAKEIWTASNMLDRLKLHGPRYAPPAARDKDLAKIEWLSCVAEWLVSLGLFGTVVGFLMALGAVDQGSLASASGVKTSIEVLMGGMRVALYTTVVGLICGLWQAVNVRMLQTALMSYWADRMAAER